MLRIIVSLSIAAVLLGAVLGAAASLQVTAGHLAAFTFPFVFVPPELSQLPP
jgi:hypothetical protein